MRSRRSSHSRSRSHHRRSYSRSPEYRRRDRSIHRSRSPRSSPVAKPAPPPEPGTFFLSRESFEEIQAQLRAKSGQPPPEPPQYSMGLPPPPRLTPFQEPIRQFVPASYPPVSFRPPQAQVVVAFPYQPPPVLPPASHPHFPPGAGFLQRPLEFVNQSQILVQHQPAIMARPVMTMHPAHILGPPHLAPPPPSQEMHIYGRPPAPFHDIRGPYPPQFEGPPPGVPDLLRPPPHFGSPEGPPPMPPHVPGSPSDEGMYGMGEGSMIETSPDAKRWKQVHNWKKNFVPQHSKRSNLISINSLEPFNG